MIVLAQKYDERIAEAFKQIIPNNPMCDELFKVLGEPFSQENWNELTKDTTLFKLTWKQSFSKDSKGQQTFYGKLLEQNIKT